MKKTPIALTAKSFMAALLTSLFITMGAAAAGGGHGVEDGHIPLDKIGWQAANLGLLLIGVFFLIKKSIVEAFKNRQKNYQEQSEKTKSSLKTAEAALAEVKAKLTGLEVGELAALENARREADSLKAQIISEAVIAAEKIKQDAELAIKHELGKAKASLNLTILNQALAITSANLREKGQTSPTEKAQHEAAFIKQIERVNT